MNADEETPRDTDAQRLQRIMARYHGQMDTFELTPETRTQLAYDLGWLTGMCDRFLRMSDEAAIHISADALLEHVLRHPRRVIEDEPDA